MAIWPTQAEVLTRRSVYGNPVGPTGGTENRVWVQNNLVLVPVPFRMAMGDIKITRIRIHKHVAPSLARILQDLLDRAKGKQATLDHWGVSRFGGSFNFRPMRGLSTLSMHAFGCAIDLDPARNGLGDSTPRFAEFPEVLKAFEVEGCTWGGDWSGDGQTADERRCDGMHWQFTRRAK
jgi:D-alanyl-D-alanine carboxypeptidase